MDKTFRQELAILIIDKFVIGFVIAGTGLWFDMRLEHFKTEIQNSAAFEKDRDSRHLDRLHAQLVEFYWPLYLQLDRDNATWKKVHDDKWEGKPEEKQLGIQLEKDFILPNHSETVHLLESKLYLADADAELLGQVNKFLRHVAVYKAVRAVGSASDPSSFGESWPSDFCPLVKKRLDALQKEYDTEMLRYKNVLQ